MAPCSEQFLKVSLNSVQRSKRSSRLEMGPPICCNGKVHVNVFSLFRYYLPLETDGTLHLNKLESLSFKDALCQVWLILAK